MASRSTTVAAGGMLVLPVDMMRPGGTRILCNPAGAGFANPAFADGLVVTVG